MKTNLAERRKAQNLGTSEVAAALGISQRTYQNYENGSTEMSYSLILKTADFFGCSTDYLLCHQTQDLIYASGLTNTQTTLIKKIKNMSERQLSILEGFVFRLEQEVNEENLTKNS